MTKLTLLQQLQNQVLKEDKTEQTLQDQLTNPHMGRANLYSYFIQKLDERGLAYQGSITSNKLIIYWYDGTEHPINILTITAEDFNKFLI